MQEKRLRTPRQNPTKFMCDLGALKLPIWVGFQVLTPVVMESSIFRDITPRIPLKAK
jgi:hypothetical protein